MNDRYSFIPPRELTDRERSVAQWIIEHGDKPEAERNRYLAQLETAKVVRRCACGCASVDFSINGKEAPAYVGLDLIGDFLCGDSECVSGIFVFAKGGMLAGIEIYSLSDSDTPQELPKPETLNPINKAR